MPSLQTRHELHLAVRYVTTITNFGILGLPMTCRSTPVEMTKKATLRNVIAPCVYEGWWLDRDRRVGPSLLSRRSNLDVPVARHQTLTLFKRDERAAHENHIASRKTGNQEERLREARGLKFSEIHRTVGTGP